MEGLAGGIPIMDWAHEDLAFSYKTFKQHVEFMFSGHLKDKQSKKVFLLNDLGWGEGSEHIYNVESQ